MKIKRPVPNDSVSPYQLYEGFVNKKPKINRNNYVLIGMLKSIDKIMYVNMHQFCTLL